MEPSDFLNVWRLFLIKGTIDGEKLEGENCLLMSTGDRPGFSSTACGLHVPASWSRYSRALRCTGCASLPNPSRERTIDSQEHVASCGWRTVKITSFPLADMQGDDCRRLSPDELRDGSRQPWSRPR